MFFTDSLTLYNIVLVQFSLMAISLRLLATLILGYFTDLVE